MRNDEKEWGDVKGRMETGRQDRWVGVVDGVGAIGAYIPQELVYGMAGELNRLKIELKGVLGLLAEAERSRAAVVKEMEERFVEKLAEARSAQVEPVAYVRLKKENAELKKRIAEMEKMYS